jgi:putative spermidine/putrescine transport system substrate-binding protein
VVEVGRGLTALVAVAGAGCLVLAGCAGSGAAPARATPAAVASPLVPSPTLTGSPSAAPAATPSPSPTALGKGEGGVSVLAFRGYVEYGGSDPKVNWVSPFEKRTGCRVSLTSVQTTQEMEDQFAKHPYDVVSASPELAGQLVAERKVAPLTTSLIPSYDEIPAWLRGLPAVESGGQVYGVPYLWGFHQLLYAPAKIPVKTPATPTPKPTVKPTGKNAVEAAPKDWGALFDGRGPVMLRDDPLTIADAALALQGKLRPKNPYQLTPQQLDAAVALLTQHKDGDRAYWQEPLEVVEGFAGGRLRLAQALPYHLDVLRRAGTPVQAVPVSRTTGWADSWMISSDTHRPNCSYQWIDYMSSRTPQKQAAAWAGLAPANPGACTGRARRMCDAYGVNDSASIARIAFAIRPAKDCGGSDGECTDYTEWGKRWRELVK